MRLTEGGVGRAASDDGEVVAFAAGDLGGEDLVQGPGEFGALRDGHRGLLGVDQPIEVAPDFAAVDLLGSVGLGQEADGLDAAKRAADVGVMLIRQIVQVDHFGPGGFQDVKELAADGGLAGVADRGARVAQLGHEGVLSDHGGGVLFADAFGGDLVVGPVLELAGAAAAASVGDGHPAEPPVGAVIAGEDSMEGHELEVILMGADAEMRRPAKGIRGGQSVREHEAGARVERDHRRREGREAAATAWPWRLSFSEGTTRSIRSSGNSSRRTASACAMMMLPPCPEVTRPMISRQPIS